MTDSRSACELGRPREFDVDEALAAAKSVFIRFGYEGTSLAQLTEAMGINKPSLYAAYGNKEELFIKVIGDYHRSYAEFARRHFLDTSEPKKKVHDWLLWILGNYESDRACCGCLLVNSASLVGGEHPRIAEMISSLHEENEIILRDFLERAQNRGDLSIEVKPAELSRFYNAVVQGMALLQRSRSSSKGLGDIVERAMQAWPANSTP